MAGASRGGGDEHVAADFGGFMLEGFDVGSGWHCLSFQVDDLRLETASQIVGRHFTIFKNGHQQAWTDCFAGVDGHDGRSSVGMPQKMVTSLNANNVEAFFLQHTQQFLGSKPR